MNENDFDYKAAFEDAQNQLIFYKQQEIQLSQALDCPVGSILHEAKICRNRIKYLESLIKEERAKDRVTVDINGKSYEIRLWDTDE